MRKTEKEMFIRRATVPLEELLAQREATIMAAAIRIGELEELAKFAKHNANAIVFGAKFLRTAKHFSQITLDKIKKYEDKYEQRL